MHALLRDLIKDPDNLAWRLEVNLQNTQSACHAKFAGKPFANRLDYQEMIEVRLYRYGYPFRGISGHDHPSISENIILNWHVDAFVYDARNGAEGYSK